MSEIWLGVKPFEIPAFSDVHISGWTFVDDVVTEEGVYLVHPWPWQQRFWHGFRRGARTWPVVGRWVKRRGPSTAMITNNAILGSWSYPPGTEVEAFRRMGALPLFSVPFLKAESNG